MNDIFYKNITNNDINKIHIEDNKNITNNDINKIHIEDDKNLSFNIENKKNITGSKNNKNLINIIRYKNKNLMN
jgi:hypothetical protein